MTTPVLVSVIDVHTAVTIELTHRRWPGEFMSHRPPFPRQPAWLALTDAMLYEILAATEALLERGDDEDAHRWAERLLSTGDAAVDDILGDEEAG